MARATPATPTRKPLRQSWANQVSAVSGTHPVWLVLATSVWMAFFGNLALWQELSAWVPLLNWHGAGLWVGSGALIALATASVLSLFAWRWTLKPVLVLCLLLVALGSHFMLNYHTLIDAAMVVNAVQTDPREAAEFVNLPLVIAVVLLALLPAWWVLRQPVQRLNLPSQAAVNVVSALAFGLCAWLLAWVLARDVKPLLQTHPELPYMVNPLNTFWGSAQALRQRAASWQNTAEPQAQPTRRAASNRPQGKPPLLVLVLGDSVRADHLGLNGYGRQTTPRLAQEDILSWRQVNSCGSSTSSALPCPLLPQTRHSGARGAASEENLLDLLQRAGLGVLWLDNQYGCKGLCDRVHSVDTSRAKVEGLCGDNGCLDEVMLLNLNDRIRALPEAQRANGVVVVMHAIGSHGPMYHRRSPLAAKTFLPECTQSLLSECKPQEVVNAYDNTLVYTDHFLAETVQWLKRQSSQYSTAMLMVSDHGESLGEKRLYMHGMPDHLAPPEQRHIPLLVWLSAQQQQRSRVSTTCLRTHLQDPVGHTHVFHSVLGLLDITAAAYRREFDLFAPCQK